MSMKLPKMTGLHIVWITVVIDILTSQKSSFLEMDFDDSNDSNESSNNVYTYTPCTG